jgi:hypothetical protein
MLKFRRGKLTRYHYLLCIGIITIVFISFTKDYFSGVEEHFNLLKGFAVGILLGSAITLIGKKKKKK